jgi:hypothetical protein
MSTTKYNEIEHDKRTMFNSSTMRDTCLLVAGLNNGFCSEGFFFLKKKTIAQIRIDKNSVPMLARVSIVDKNKGFCVRHTTNNKQLTNDTHGTCSDSLSLPSPSGSAFAAADDDDSPAAVRIETMFSSEAANKQKQE